ncbi:aminotransferase class I/II-fold pyridoxal phosphate-dependent enzyme [Tabrizicola sp.]|uniref:aminotransferase class I/II-fold pyridoxal phosphate-dependent enzyme n=1 Tax=Tabrizicola sp. TaxID=2005166 RepID=UPI003F2F1501
MHRLAAPSSASILLDPSLSVQPPAVEPRIAHGVAAAHCAVFDPKGHAAAGMNFAAQDYLSLAGHPALRAAAATALSHHRLGAPGTAPQLGLTVPALTLEDRVARFVQQPEAVVFPSGAEAIRATLRCTLREGDHLIVDAGAHPAMFDTGIATRATVHRTPPGSVDAVERRLRRLSGQPRQGRLFVAVPAVSAHASVIADLRGLADLCRDYDATLIVDVTHDLGSMAQGGGGVMEIQGCLGRVGIVVGSFAKCFGAAGGFAAFADPELKQALRLTQHGQRQTAALSPVNATVILAAFDLIDSVQGRIRRRRLHSSALRLRNHLMADGIRVMGQPSPLVPIRLPMMTARPRTALMESAGALVTLLMAPAVALHAPRWRVQLMADHSAADIDDLADLIRDVTRVFDRHRPLAPSPAPLAQA